ncbi:MAG: hypothetical protein Q9210_000555 [Variospora velana]
MGTNGKTQSDDESTEATSKKGTLASLVSKLRSKSNEMSTFAGDAASLDKYYVPIDSYEGRHRYDPKATWSKDEEQSLIRKLDIRVCAYCCLMFFALQLDRGNISQALSDTFLEDLGMNTNDFNTGQTIFYVSFLAAELPSQLISKKIGPDNWIPIQMISWSIVACCQAKLTGRATFFLTRALLGIIEGGFIPDVILYLSYFYKSKELPIRLSFFWGAYGCTFIVSAFLAFGILHLRGYQGLAGWQWLFALEGGLTVLIGIFSWLYLPPSPYQTANTRQAVTPSLLWQALKDYDMWPIYLLGFTWTTPHICATAYLTLVLRGLNFDTFETNLLTVPAYVLFITQLVFWTWVSEKINNRYLVVLLCQIYMFPLLVGLEVLPAGAAYAWSRYVLNMMLVGFPYVHAIIGELPSSTPPMDLPFLFQGAKGKKFRFLRVVECVGCSRHNKPQRRLRPYMSKEGSMKCLV